MRVEQIRQRMKMLWSMGDDGIGMLDWEQMEDGEIREIYGWVANLPPSMFTAGFFEATI